jgi:hypothetical protein
MKNSTLIIALTSITFTIAAVVVIGNRLSEQTLTLMTGALIGGFIGLALGVLIGWYMKSQRAPERWQASYTPPQSTVILAAPQQQSPTASTAWQSAYSLTPSYPTPQPKNPRQFTIGGEEIIYHESDAAW